MGRETGADERVQTSFQKLRDFCEREGFRGWDPYDGLNSRVFRALPGLKHSRLARLAWIQAFKRNPMNLRPLLLVRKGYNPKGLGLFLHGYCNLYRIDPAPEYLEKIEMLSEKVIGLISPGYAGACWGYNFDWQAKAFFQPGYTPTVVASTFIGTALLEAYEITGETRLRDTAVSVADFILKDLNRTYDDEGDFSFSYSPLDRTQVFNASLLGSRMLSRIYPITGDRNLIEEAERSVRFAVKHQKKDGSWAYSTLPYHQWIDNFHTGYNLECIHQFQNYSGSNLYDEEIRKGLAYYLDNFFMEDGRCKYYNNSLYPIDIHAAAQFIITLNRLGLHGRHRDRAMKVLGWVIEHMQHPTGYFYYQLKKRMNSRIPYIRWAQAWMFYAFTDHLLYDHQAASTS